MPLISVIVPVYNSEQYLRECLDSVFAQTLENFEIILIDDGSTDGSEEIYNSFDDKRLRIYRQENRGVALARNYAMSLALGEFIACLDSDDIWRSDKLKVQYNFISNHSEYSLVGSYCDVVDMQGEFIYMYNRIPINDSDIRRYMQHDNPIITSSAFFRKDDAVNVGGFYDEIRTNSEDYPLWVKLAKLGKVHNVPESLVSYRVVPSSLSIGAAKSQIRQLFLNLAHSSKYTEEEKELYKKLMQTDKSIRTRDHAYYLALSKLYLFDGNNKKKFITNLYHAVKSNPKVLKAYTLLPFVFLPCKFNKFVKDCYIQFSR
jgi:glycosyltransferase involved in cell wall biosynthesis